MYKYLYIIYIIILFLSLNVSSNIITINSPIENQIIYDSNVFINYKIDQTVDSYTTVQLLNKHDKILATSTYTKEEIMYNMIIYIKNISKQINYFKIKISLYIHQTLVTEGTIPIILVNNKTTTKTRYVAPTVKWTVGTKSIIHKTTVNTTVNKNILKNNSAKIHNYITFLYFILLSIQF